MQTQTYRMRSTPRPIPTNSASCVLCLGTQTKYIPAVAATAARKETAGDRRHSVHAYRRMPPKRIERMNCAIIDETRTA